MQRGQMHRSVLIAAGMCALYLAVAAAPVLIAGAYDLPRRPFLDDFSSGIAMVGFTMLLVEFVLSGRFRAFSATMGIDLAMQMHQLLARTALVLVLIHPLLYTLPLAPQRPWDPTLELTLGLTPAATITGLIAWGGLAVLVAAAICRNSFTWRYETWRFAHGLGALLVAAAGLHHALAAGRYSQLPGVLAFWWLAFGVAVASLMLVYVVRPLLQRRRRYRVKSVMKAASLTWEVELAPDGPARLAYEAGQFAWLKLGSTRPLFENPFSFSSAPADGENLRFLIKEAGDLTDGIGRVTPGTAAYLDGPHGHFTLDPAHKGGVVLIAGGIGVAPMLSLLREAAATNDPRPFILVYGNWAREQMVDVERLAGTTRLRDFRYCPVLAEPPTDWTGARGDLDRGNLSRTLPQTDRAAWVYFICGPTAMIDSVERTLDELGVPLARIVSEKFQYDFGRRTRRNRRTVGAWLAISAALVAAAALFALR